MEKDLSRAWRSVEERLKADTKNLLREVQEVLAKAREFKGIEAVS